MPEEDSGAGEMQQAQEVVDMTFPARDETTRVVEPRGRAVRSSSVGARDGAHGHPAWTVDPAGVPRSSRCRTGSSDVRRGHRCRSRGRRSGASGGPRGSGRRGWRGRGAAHTVKRGLLALDRYRPLRSFGFTPSGQGLAQSSYLHHWVGVRCRQVSLTWLAPPTWKLTLIHLWGAVPTREGARQSRSRSRI